MTAVSNVISRNVSRRKPIAMGIAAVFALVSSAALHAATTYIVSTCDDSSPAKAGSLRLAANSAVSGDVINMTGLSASSPSCSGAINGFSSFMLVNSTVTVAGGVTINGPGKAAFAVSAAAANGPSFSSNGALTINDLGVKYGARYSNTGTSAGGCIRTTGNLTLSNVKALHCSAASNSGLTRGGAVYSAGTVTATGSNFVNNYATSTSGVVRGGAIFATGDITLTDSTVTCNNYNGGSCKTTYASSGSGAARGGALSSYAGTVSVYNSRIYGSAKTTGATSGTVYGGAIYAAGGAYIGQNSIVSGYAGVQSAAIVKGGGVFAKQHVYVEGSSYIFDSNAYSKGGTSYGGGIYSAGGPVWVKYSALDFNSAKRGGGLYAANGGVWAKYSLIEGNYATNGGGGILNKAGASTLIQGSTIYRNGSNSGFSGIDHFAGGASTVTIKNSTISSNFVNGTGAEAAAYIRAYATVIDNSTIVYNSGHGSAAGAAALSVFAGNAGSTLDLNSALFSSNSNDAGDDDLFVQGGSGGVTFTSGSSHNLVRVPGGGVPGDTITGKCPLLHPISYGGKGFLYVYRPEIKSPATDHGSNPLNLGADQRGDSNTATTPARASGPGKNNTSPIPDIGAYEIDQNDIIFDQRFETCT